jgi:hypothetical protein
MKRARFSVAQNAAQTNTIQTESINYDPDTGKKAFATKQMIQTIQTASHQETKEEWHSVKLERKKALNVFVSQSDRAAKTKSVLFLEYESAFQSAISRFYKRLQIIVNPYQDIDLFGSIACASDQEDRLLLCLWTWREILQFGHNMEFIRKFVQNDPAERPMFFITSEMVASHTLGRLLWNHIPLLNKLRNLPPEPLLPVFESLSMPPEDSPKPVQAMFRYSFLLQDCFDSTIHSKSIDQMKLAPNCAMEGICWIAVDGPLTKLFSRETNEAIFDHFEQMALTVNVPQKRPLFLTQEHNPGTVTVCKE